MAPELLVDFLPDFLRSPGAEKRVMIGVVENSEPDKIEDLLAVADRDEHTSQMDPPVIPVESSIDRN